MKECPECKGKGRIEITYPEMTTSEKPPKTRKEVCRLCRGKGEVDKLSLGIYKARGNKLPPTEAKGYA